MIPFWNATLPLDSRVQFVFDGIEFNFPSTSELDILGFLPSIEK